MDSGRGASSVSGVARVVQTLYGMSTKDAKRCGVPEAQRHLFVRLDDAKANLSISSGQPLWFRRDTIEVPVPGDQATVEPVGVLTPVQLTIVEEEDDMEALDKVVLGICNGRPRLLADVIREMQTMPEFAGLSRTTLDSRLKAANSDAWWCEQKAGKEKAGPWRVVPGSEIVTDFGLDDVAQ